MRDTKQVGNCIELKSISRFYDLGYTVSIPYGDSNKYDFILDCHNKLYKIQCKTPREILDEKTGQPTCIYIPLTYQTGYTKNNPAIRNYYTDKDIDYFVTNYKGINYLLPVVQQSMITLRILPTKRKSIKSKFLEDYKDTKILESDISAV